MNELDVLELLNTRLLTLELIVSELHETLIDNGVIDKDKFNESLNKKISDLKKLTDSFKEDSDEINISTMFGGPIGEA